MLIWVWHTLWKLSIYIKGQSVTRDPQGDRKSSTSESTWHGEMDVDIQSMNRIWEQTGRAVEDNSVEMAGSQHPRGLTGSRGEKFRSGLEPLEI